VYAVDPFMGYGGSEEDYAIFQKRCDDVPNIVHIRKPSGEGARELTGKPISFVFIDAVHDYANVLFDGSVWFDILRPGGLIAFHDVDEVVFAGTRRAVREIARRAELESHVSGLIILRKPAS
jgi:predicted O-methyltransferase YrrM